MSAQGGSETATSLRDRQAAATREEIVSVAMNLLVGHADVPHELIAKTAGMSSRTVYRHFPDRNALMVAIWQRLREMMQIQFPVAEQQIIPLARQSFAALNENEALVHAIMSSVSGARIQSLPGYEGREAFHKSLLPLLEGVPRKQRRWIVASFVAIYSAPFWQLLRTRGELSSAESLEATTWVLTALLDDLHSQSRKKRNTR